VRNRAHKVESSTRGVQVGRSYTRRVRAKRKPCSLRDRSS
jgi:hypothetical protein